MSFDALGLCDALVQAVADKGYTVASQIQGEAIPAILNQRDVMAVAQTGTGKTAAFTLPVLQLLSAGESAQPHHVRALIITPTRELAAQVAKSVENYSGLLNIRSGAVFGGVRIEPQIRQLQQGVDVLVATPGRLIDLYNQQAISFEHLEILVLDEADRMLDLGFVEDIQHIQTLLPSKRQTLLFSATFSNDIQTFAKNMLNMPLIIAVTAVNSTVNTVAQTFHPVDKERKSEVLIHLIKKHQWQQALVFVRTKRSADSLVTQLESAGISAASIHANRTQHARTLALDGFKNASIRVLVATDIAARGIDVNQLNCVVNFDLPYVPEDYVHRIGRTGRAGYTGLAVSLFSEDETKQLLSIERFIGVQFKREFILGFTPKHKASSASALSKNTTSDNPNRKNESAKKQHDGKVSKGKSSNDYDDDLYGNFEANSQTAHRGQKQGASVAKRSRKK
ncbi:DEAD/DEAH box helicase [Paraglaciecola polaris]|uniref:DEAD-box ATP-dependent RNA helicase cshA n=1 Tax=Paraglaciecola polaris LMG 21857 TaxID=1129793 RepID=K7AB76_9ALTE|nr:DEAD/DEAH box helicase [Paraglaciecola polaris]GAC32630.1 DEAD-box ATP-dependent RNA helicase cshA [Paraglaciecola polaris LMG 21857]